MELKNKELILVLDAFGNISSIGSVRNDQVVAMTQDVLEVSSDFGTFRTTDCIPDIDQTHATSITYQYDTPSCIYRITYRLSKSSYIERLLSVIPKQSMTIYKVRTIDWFEQTPLEIIDYHTFWNCPTTEFVRFESDGLYAGFANPCFSAHSEDNRLEIQFEPYMTVSPDELWTVESNFWGIYRFSGEMVEQQIPRTSIRYNNVSHPRYRNPSGYIALDRNEIRSFKQFADDYLDLRVTDFKVVFYNFFSPLPQQPETEEDEQMYYHYIDNFVRMGGDIITFNPLVRNRPPLPNQDSFWELAPDGSAAERILNYAKDKGLKIGFYMGSAPDNSNYCDSPMTEFASTFEKPNWKKMGICGERSRENCIADDDFAEWFYQVQKNTIEKYGITLWNWDPGPGNGFFCYSAEHGHVPGKGAYKGFRNAMNLVKRLKDTFPELYIQGFHGTKEYGLWGFRGFDQHEAYWEQCPYDAGTIYPDLSEDRLTASGMRFQSWWNQNFRFMPAVINHSLAHRMTQYCADPRELLYLFDHLGWKYGIISALAAGASITVPMIPYDPEDIYGDYISFFRKWVQWGRDHFQYNQNAVAFGNQVVCGTVDGYSKILDDHGFLFLCNAAPIRSEIALKLDDEIGLEMPGEYTLKQIYPMEEIQFFDESLGKGTFSYGETIHVQVPQYEVLVFELEKAQPAPISLYGINGSIHLEGETLHIMGSSAPESSILNGFIQAPQFNMIRRLMINGKEIPFSRKDSSLVFSLQYGEGNAARYLYDWIDQNDETISCPNYESMETVTLHTSFFATHAIREVLQNARPKNAEQIEALIPVLRDQLHRENFAWALPYRLFLVVPFSDAAAVGTVTISINGEIYQHTRVTVNHYGKESKLIDYLDITDLVEWDKENRITLSIEQLPQNHFLGAYLYYPPFAETDVVTVPANILPEPVASSPLYQLVQSKPWYAKNGRQVRVESSWINRNLVEEMQDYTIYASVNLESEKLEGVYFSTQVCIDQTNDTLKADEMMEYDSVRKIWKRTLHMGNRQLLIIDGEYIYVWAVTKDHYVSPTYKVKVEWKLF